MQTCVCLCLRPFLHVRLHVQPHLFYYLPYCDILTLAPVHFAGKTENKQEVRRERARGGERNKPNQAAQSSENIRCAKRRVFPPSPPETEPSEREDSASKRLDGGKSGLRFFGLLNGLFQHNTPPSTKKCRPPRVVHQIQKQTSETEARSSPKKGERLQEKTLQNIGEHFPLQSDRQGERDMGVEEGPLLPASPPFLFEQPTSISLSRGSLMFFLASFSFSGGVPVLSGWTFSTKIIFAVLPRACKPWFPNRGSRFVTKQRLN